MENVICIELCLLTGNLFNVQPGSEISSSGCFAQVSFCFKKHLPSDLNFPNLFLCNLSKKFEVTRKWTIKAGRSQTVSSIFQSIKTLANPVTRPGEV